MPGRYSKHHKSEGLTLIEVMIASALFILVAGVLMFIFNVSRDRMKRHEQQSLALRTCLVTAEHLRSELETAWVESPLIGDLNSEVVYRQPLRGADGLVRVGPTGDVFLAPPRTINLSGGKLMRDEGGSRRVLANLDPSATLEFKRTSQTLLEVTVSSSVGSGFTLTRSMRLNNQY